MEYKEINELPNRLREPLVEYHAKQSFIRNPDTLNHIIYQSH